MMNRQDPVPDEALIQAVQGGDRNAAARLYDRHVDRVHRICYRIVLDPSQVQDCVQEVWLKVFRKLGRFRCDRSFAGWLNTVTANTAIDYYRRLVKHRNHVKNGGIHPGSAAVNRNPGNRRLDSEFVNKRIRDALEGISAKQRTAFILRYYEDASISEIARTLGCAEGAVRTHIRRSLLALRTRLAGKIDV
ncbi:MAG: sigma-70 family RNA polymerase sigma factor [Phycisphaerales bacterium]|nr:MAG: sigma-70 family RNA polymerase sigma factor [Phycisphaerales bacterium]